MFLNRSCREVTRLVIEGEDRELNLADRLALRIHWRICSNCVRFRDQTRLMRKAMKRWRQGELDGSEAQRNFDTRP